MKTPNLRLLQKGFLIGCLSLLICSGIHGQSINIDKASRLPDQIIQTAPVEKTDATRMALVMNIDTIKELKNIPAWINANRKYNDKNSVSAESITRLERQFLSQLPVHPSYNSVTELHPARHPGSRNKSGDKIKETFELSDEADRIIEDQGSELYIFTYFEEMPPNAVISDIEYEIRIDDNSNEANFYPIDYEIYIGTESKEVCVYDNHGTDHTDGGYDDDEADDSDIYLNFRSSSSFYGEDVSNYYTVRIEDLYLGGEGLVDYVCLRITWEAPSPNLRANYTFSDWSAPIMLTHNSSLLTQDPILYAGVSTYFRTSFYNFSENACPEPFYFDVLVDGSIILHDNNTEIGSWVYHKIGFWEPGYTAGPHTVCQKVDPDNQIWWETDETDNEYCRTYTFVGPPDPPTLSSPSNATTCQPTELTFSWNTSANATSYRLQVNTSSDFGSPIVDIAVSGTSQLISGLTADTRYFWRVRASNPAGDGSYSSLQYFTTIPSSGPSVPNLAGPPDEQECQETTLTLHWAGVSHVTIYNLQVDDNTDFGSPVYDQSGIEDYSQEVSGLNAGTTYYWRVQSVSDCGLESEWSSSRSFNTIPTTIAPPSLTDPGNATECQPTNLTLSWESMPHVMSYFLEVDNNDDFSSTEDGDNTGYTSHTCDGLSENTIYYWRVSAHSCGVDGTWSDIWNFKTGSGGMVVPSLSEPTDSSIDKPVSLTLQWEAVTDAMSYQFQLNDTNDFTAPLQDEEVNDTSIEIDELEEVTIYYWHVRANGDCSASDWSDTWQFETGTSGPDALTDARNNGYYLGQNHPNPFTGTTIIEFTLPVENHVSIEFIDLQGKLIELFEGYYTAGTHSVEINMDGKVRTGVYFYRMKTSDFIDTKLCILR